MAGNALQYLLTHRWIRNFKLALAEVEFEHAKSASARKGLLEAEANGYRSTIETLETEAQDYEDRCIRVLHNEDDGYYTALCDEHPRLHGIESTPEGALRELREALSMAVRLPEEL